MGAHRDRAWASLCPASARPGAVGQAGAPFQAGVVLSHGGTNLASAQETCLDSHSMQACSKAIPLSGLHVMQSCLGRSKAVSMMRISTWLCSPTAQACPRSLLLAHAIQQCCHHAAAKCCTRIDRHSHLESRHKGMHPTAGGAPRYS